jgi:hypothetical protein
MVKIPPSNANQDWDVWFTRFMAIPPNALGRRIVPSNYTTADGYKLGMWQSAQRAAYSKATLSSEHIRELDEAGIVWNQQDMQWEDALQAFASWAQDESGKCETAAHCPPFVTDIVAARFDRASLPIYACPFVRPASLFCTAHYSRSPCSVECCARLNQARGASALRDAGRLATGFLAVGAAAGVQEAYAEQEARGAPRESRLRLGCERRQLE